MPTACAVGCIFVPLRGWGWNAFGAGGKGGGRGELNPPRFNMSAQDRFDSLAQRRRTFFQSIVQRTKEIRELLFGPIEYILREESAAGPEFSQRDAVRRAQNAPHLVELAGHEAPEDRMHVARSVEVPRFSELRGVAGVVAEFGIVKAQFHVTRERNRAAFPNLPFDFLAESAHSPFWRRSGGSCGVRINISMK